MVDPVQAKAAAEALVEASSSAEPPVEVAPDTEPVPVVLVWKGIGNLHRGFFSDQAAVRRLGQDLSGQVRGTVNLHVRYDQQAFLGHLHLQLLPDTLSQPIPAEGDVIGLQALAPLTSAVARYRSAIAGRYDLRVESFRVGVESFRGARQCVFRAAGAAPTDGRVVSPCVEINGQEQCGAPEQAGVRFAASAAKDIRACLDLG